MKQTDCHTASYFYAANSLHQVIITEQNGHVDITMLTYFNTIHTNTQI